MANIETHAPGAFSWLELATTDQNGAKNFYTSLFGWSFEDTPIGPNDYYTMLRLRGRNAAALYTMRDDEVAMGFPSHWNMYITVENAEAANERAVALGGTLLYGPLDVATHGRMSVIQDPTGAVFHTWQPKGHIGVGVAGEPGAFCWADLSTPDQASAAAFYSGLFGYELPPGDGGYLHLQNGEAFIGGIQPPAHRDPGTPPHWLVYIQVEDCEAMTAKAQGLGARVYAGPMKMEKVGWMTVLADPQGAVFAMFQPNPER
jgi:predicted enzyme related to lactoylglutathione lyase